MDATYLFAALVWSSVGFGFFVYGKKQRKLIPLIGGLLLMGITYAIRIPLTLSFAGLVIIGTMYLLRNIQ